MSGAPWRLRPLIDWPAVLFSIVADVVLLAIFATPVSLMVAWLVQLAHRFDSTVPALSYGAVWALVYAAGLVRAFMHLEITFTPR